MKSLHALSHQLSDSFIQLKVLNRVDEKTVSLPAFSAKLLSADLYPLTPVSIDTLQVNVGKMCNQTCKHCHVDAGPDRKEIMSRETMQQCLHVLRNSDIKIVDITGGAPEMNPDFRWFVEEISKLNLRIIVRCNLTIIMANRKYLDLPRFFKEHHVEVVSSLPYYSSHKTDAQRGKGVFDDSIKALQMLNAEGYGINGSGLILNLVYNPSGAFLPAPEAALEGDFKRELKKRFNIDFNNLFAITNLPVSRFLDYLIQSENYDSYMEKLVASFNPVAASKVMCRSMISVGWDGYLYDCDFNQMLDMKISNGYTDHISNFSEAQLLTREILINQHCYGCTAGAGSGCGGELIS